MWIAIQNAVGARQGVGGGPGPTPPYTPPMDAYPADVAYSVRLVSTSYTGPCIEAYRVSDGATQDIGFDSNGRISATELAAFSGGSVLEVQTWYDQMPGANHAISTINDTTGTLTRAIIYSGSSIITDGIEPALDFVNPTDYPTLRFSNLGAASGYESFQVSTAATTNSGTPLYVTSIPYNFNYHQPISYPNGNVYEGFGSNTRPALLGIGFPNMYMQHVYNTTAGPTKNVLINNTLIATASSAANIGSLSHYISAMAKTQVGDDPKGRYIGYIKELFIYKSIQTSGVRDVLTSNINNFYQIGNFPDYTSGFLADYPGAAAAYSVRQLSNTAIKCMRVRRAVAPFDEKDIGFTAGGDLDEAAIVAFGGSDVLVVSAWYDQSGQSRHATQITPNSQPQIYNGTAVITENGKPYIKYGLLETGLSFGSDNWIFSAAGNLSNNTKLFFARSGSGYLGTMQSGSVSTGVNSNAGTLTAFRNGSSYSFTTRDALYTDIGTQSLFTVNQDSSNWTNVTLGYSATADQRCWSMHEVVIYDTDQSSNRTGIETNINTYYDVYTMYNPDAPTSGFLFDYPNASTAYSVRQLNNNATVSMRVRRAVAPFDEQDIGFVNGDLDEAAIVAFGGSDALTVSAWYDQSGNQRHATQITPGAQPQIYNGAAVLTENGRPAVQFDGSNDYLSLTSTAVTNSVCQILVSVYDTSVSSLKMPLGGGPTTWWQHYSANRIRINTTSGQVIFASGLSNGTQYLGFMNGNSGAYTFHLNGTSKFSGTVGNWYIDTIGRGLNSNTYAFNDPIQEVILYESEKSSSRTAIESDIMTYYNIP